MRYGLGMTGNETVETLPDLSETTEQASQPNSDDMHPEFDISDDDLKALATSQWTPNPKHLLWVKGYVSSGPKASRRKVAMSLGLSYKTVCSWYQLSAPFCAWMRAVAVEYYTGCNVPGIWLMLRDAAAKGDKKAAEMVLMRADPAYAAIKNKQPIVVAPTPDAGMLKAAEHAQQ